MLCILSGIFSAIPTAVFPVGDEYALLQRRASNGPMQSQPLGEPAIF
jgi:hypothetical protein